MFLPPLWAGTCRPLPSSGRCATRVLFAVFLVGAMSGASTGPILPVINVPVRYEEERDKIQDFLEHFKAPLDLVPPLSDVGTTQASSMPDETRAMDIEEDAAPDAMVNKYMIQLQRIANRDQEMIVIELDDVAQFSSTSGFVGGALVASIQALSLIHI